jgi:uncharacterized repeat protein (TIGR01451 family)
LQIIKYHTLKINFTLLAFTLFFSISSFSQIVNIPDVNLKNALINSNVTDTTGNNSLDSDIDLNNDGEIQLSEALAIDNLNISNKNINSLEGLQFFTNLVSLYSGNNNISFVPQLNLNNLTALNLRYNSITSIGLSGLPILNSLDVFNNQISSLNVTASANLITLFASNNNIASLNVSQNTLLRDLTLKDNPISSLDISLNPNIEQLNIENTLITNLDVINQIGFLDLNVSNTPLTSLTGLSNKIGFDFIYIENTQLTTLTMDNIEGVAPDISIANNPLLTDITITNSRFLNFRIDNNSNLTTITATGNDINGIDFDGNGLENIDFEGNKEMGYLNIVNENNLTNLNLNNTSFQWSLDITDCSIDHIFLKNGIADIINFTGTNSINYICGDSDEILALSAALNNSGITNVNLNTYCTFTPGGDLHQITGDARIDADLNGCSTNDTRFTDFKFNVNNGTSSAIFFESPGYDYEIAVPEGNYTITPEPIVPALYNSVNSFLASFTAGSPDITQDICLIPNGTVVDFSTIMFEDRPARPGFDANYRLHYKNNGTAASDGVLFISYDDSRMDFLSSDVTFQSNNNGIIRWDFGTMQPNEERLINLTFNINSPMETPAVNGGDILTFNGNISPPSGITDFNPLDNTFEYSQTVVNSFDPNDITCLEGENLDPADVGKDLHYKIRFENTGTASAINVVVKNEIDLSKLDINTLVPITSSHSMRTRIIEGNIVEFIFENINLDFNNATNDGYLIYKIKSLPTLQLGDVINNQAEIYFDFNFPIITNTYITTVLQTASSSDYSSNIISLFPNPSNGLITITSQSNIETVQIYDHLGRIIKTAINNELSSEMDFNLSELSSGLYFIEVSSNLGKQNMKFIKE